MFSRIVLSLLVVLCLAPLSFASGWHVPSEIVAGNFSGTYYTFENATVSVGSSSPLGQLYVAGGDIYLDDGDAIQLASASPNSMKIERDTTNNGMSLFSGSSSRLFIADGGNVGVSTLAPVSALDVNGTGRLTDLILTNKVSCTLLYTDASGNVLCNTSLESSSSLWTNNSGNIYIDDADVIVGGTSPLARFQVTNDRGGGSGRFLIDANVSSGYSSAVNVTDSGTEFTTYSNSRGYLFKVGNPTPSTLVTFEPGGDVGIGIDNPQSRLHVNSTDEADVATFIGPSTGGYLALLRGTAYQWYLGIEADSDFYISRGTTNDADKVFFGDSSTGFVGINDTTPSTTLGVGGQVGATEYCDENGANCFDYTNLSSGSSSLWTNSSGNATFTSGNVGVGTTTPNDLFIVNDTVRENETTANFIGIGTKDPTTTGAFGIEITNRDLTTNSLSEIGFNFYDAGGGQRHSGAIVAGKEGTWTGGGGSYPSYISIWTRPSSGEEVERLRVSANGNVTIGTTTPSGSLLLDVEGQIGATEFCDENGANCFDYTNLSGGGSDADTLDGLDSSQFLRADTSDTTTGVLTVNDNDGTDYEELFVIGDSNDYDSAKIYGSLEIGSGAVAGADELVDIDHTFSTEANITMVSIDPEFTFSPVGDSSLQGLDIYLDSDVSQGSHEVDLEAMRASIYHSSSADSDYLTGVYSDIIDYHSGSTMSESRGFYSRQRLYGSGTITNAIGLESDIQTTLSSDITNARGIDVSFSGGATDARGVYAVVTTDSYPNIGTAYGAYYSVTTNSYGNITTAYGNYARLRATSFGKITTGYGYYSFIESPGLTKLDNAYGFYSDCDDATTCYGFRYVGGDSAVTTDWGVYTSGEDKNYFSGEVGIGATSPASKVEIEDTSSNNNVLYLQDSDGSCEAQPASGSLTWSCSSDERLKENIRDADSAVDYFSDFKVRDYTITASGLETTGVIAQEVLEVKPELVIEGDEGYLQVETPNTWKLVKAIQEQQEQIEALQAIVCLDHPELEACQ